MGFRELVEEKKSRPEGVCPTCEKEAEETEHSGMRCTNSSCEVLYYIPNDYQRDLKI